MRLLIFAFASIALFGFAMAVRAEDAAAVGELLEDWHDAARDRTVPVKIDYPKTITDPLPVVIFSHGLGGSREGLAYIGQYVAAHGYISVHLQHPGSDQAIWKGMEPAEAMKGMKAATTVVQFSARLKDVKFALDELARRNDDASWPLHGKLNLKEIAMAGHSFGAVTTQAMCGQIYMGGRTFFDPRIKVGIAFSPSPSNNVESKKAFAHMTLPMLYWTGTRDDAPAFASNVKAPQRRIPFDVGSGNDEYLIILTDADHMVFNGPAASELFKSQEAQSNATTWLEIINKGTTAFLDKYLKHDTARGKYLDEDGGFAKDLGQLGTFEKKKQ